MQSSNQSAWNVTYASAHQQCVENLSPSSWKSFLYSWYMGLKGPYTSHLPLWDYGLFAVF